MEPHLSLVLPAYNEEARLPAALERLAGFAVHSGLRLEIVVADDGSTDATPDVAREWMAGPGDGIAVRLVQISHRGKGAAVRAGIRRAAAPVVGYCDVDLSAGPDALSRLYDEMANGADVAISSRGLPESVLEVRQPWYRERGGRLFNLLLRKLARIEFRDTQCGLKLFRREVAREMFRYQRLDGFAFDAELIVLAVRLGFDVREVPIRWAHDAGSKLSVPREALRMSRDIVTIVRRLGRGKVHELGVPSPAAIAMMASAEERHWWHVAKRRMVKAAIDGRRPAGPCLDVGCGAGGVLAEVSASVPVVGVDLSTDALAFARARGITGLVRGEAGALPFASGSFSAALALDVIEHHPRPEELLREIRRVLADDGILIVTVPAFQWMWSYADHVLGHYRRYTRRQLAAELEATGFAPERVTYFHSWLLPLAWLFRKIRPLVGRSETADDFPVPAPLNRLLSAVCAMEMRWLAHRDLPFGLSVLAVAPPARVPSGSQAGARAAPATNGHRPALHIGPSSKASADGAVEQQAN
ncbi:MAG: glycosyltransferase [Actinomycetota bacterium]